MYLEVMGCSCYTCLPRTALAAAQSAWKTAAAPGTGTGAPQMDQRSTHEHMAKTMHDNKHTSKL